MTSWGEIFALMVGLLAGSGAYMLIVPHASGRAQEAHQLQAQTVLRRTFASSQARLKQTTISAATGLLAGSLATIITGVIGLGIAAACIAFLAGAWIRSRRHEQHLRKIESFYPDFIEALISQVRSGTGLLAAVAAASVTAPPALADPARHMWFSVQLSGDVSACLDELKTQWSSPTGDLLVETIRVAHAAGGNRVVDVLRELADHVRRERNLRREVEAKQSWVRVAARVGVAAPWVVLVLLSFRAETAAAYNSPMGVTLVLCGLALSLVSYRLMISLGRTPSARRVFSS